MLASPFSRSGKTLITLGILRAMKNMGIAISSAKAGPDYIDTAFHHAACGVTTFNLDSWAMRHELIKALVTPTIHSNRILIVEAMMGLFDGAIDGTGSAATLARMLGLPIILIIDCSRFSHSVAPLVYGFKNYCKDIDIAGLILNKIGSDQHASMLLDALTPLAIPVVGIIPRCETLILPERHLGLVQSCEHGCFENFIRQAAQIVSSRINLELILHISRLGLQKGEAVDTITFPFLASPGNHIAIAYDDAFRFIYSHIITGWRNYGATISFFSPLADEGPPVHADVIYLPGGYPELHAGKLAKAACFKQAMRSASEAQRMIYGECGGYMVLGQILEDACGISHEMLGLLPLATSFKRSKRHLGYRKLEPVNQFVWMKSLRGHEFHYASTLWQDDATPLFKIQDAINNDLGTAGLQKGSIAGSFMHIIDYEK